MSVNLESSPYFDDYNEEKGFYKILFKPGLAVQARELTQLQTSLQKQIERFGTHVFKEGARVLDASFHYTDELHSVKLTSLFNGVSVDDYIEQYVGKIVRGETSGVEAQVVAYTKSTEVDPPTLFVSYTQSGYDKISNVFQDAERIITPLESVYNFNAEEASLSTAAVGCANIGTSAAIETGVYFTQGHFVYVPAQRIIISKYTNTPSVRIGLQVSEHIISHTDDSSLLDNAQGTPNFAAPGADRYSIDLELVAIDPNTPVDVSFIELERVNAGRLLAKVRTSEYNVLEDNLAKRTYDTNGDYIVNKFRMKMRESVDDGTNDGVFPEGATTDDGNVASDNLMAFHISEGKAFVKGYGIETTQPLFIDVEKSRTYKQYDNVSLPMEVGNYTYIQNLNNIPDIVGKQGNPNFDPYTKLQLNDGANIIGVSRPRSLEFSDASPSNIDVFTNEQFKLFMFDIKMFTTITMSGNINVTQGDKVYGQFSKATGFVYEDSTTNTLNLMSVSGEFSNTEELLVGGVSIGAGITVQSVVKHKFEEVVGVYSPIDNFSADVVRYEKTDVLGNGTGVFYSQLEDPEKNIMLRSLPKSSVRTLETDANGNLPVTSLEVRRQFKDTTDVNGEFTITSGAGETFNTHSNIDYQISVVTAGTGTAAAGDTVNLDSADLTVTGAGTNSITFSSPAIFGNGAQVKVFATINRQTTSSKAKVANSMQLLNVADNGLGGIYGTSTSHEEISFGVADVYKVRAIYCSGVAGTAAVPPSVTLSSITGVFQSGEQIIGQTSGAVGRLINTTNYDLVIESEEVFQAGEAILGKTTNSSATVDTYTKGSQNVLSRYMLDTGQRDAFYDISRLRLKPRQSTPIGDFLVVFDYFDHNEGDYFSVDSYSDIDYADIPNYTTAFVDLESTASSGQYDLRSTIDFRCRVGDIPSTTVGGIKTVTGASFDYNSRTYDVGITSASVINTPKDNANFESDFEYYLPRKDALFLTSEGEFKYVKGAAAERPVAPADIDNAMRLADVTLSAYTFDMYDVTVRIHEARRYTMRDIGKLDTRLGNVEYYTSLSLLEQEASSLQIKDANGLDRFKSGFIVDEFSGHGIGDVNHPDYRCAIDMANKTLRPKFVMKNIELEEAVDNNTDRLLANYTVSNEMATLPYADTALITQPKASKVENVNPVLKITWIGDLTLTPSMDTWFETKRLPTVTQNRMGNFDTVMAQNKNALGTVWDAPVTQWTGVKTTTVKEKSEPHAILDTAPFENLTLVDWHLGEIDRIGGIMRQQVTERTTTTRTGVKTRKGVRTNVIETIDYESQGDRLVGTTLIPYCRENWVFFEGSGFKPSTRVYPFFDNIDVSKYVTPAGGTVISDGTSTTQAFVSGIWSFISSAEVYFDNNRNSEVELKLEYSTSLEGQYVTLGTATSAALRTSNFDQLAITINDSVALPNDFGEVYLRISATRPNGSPLSGRKSRGRIQSKWKSRRKSRFSRLAQSFRNRFNLNGNSDFEISEIRFTDNNGSTVDTQYLEIVSFDNIVDAHKAIDGTVNTNSDRTNDSEASVPNSGKNSASVTIKVVGGTASKTPSTSTINRVNPSSIEPGALVTDTAGNISGWFNIPDPNVPGNPKFETGTRQFRLSSSSENSKSQVKTFGDADYTAKGVLNKIQETIIATKNAIVKKTDLKRSTKVSKTSTKTEQYFVDPLAQSFAIDLEGGCFLTKVDLYFSTKDNSIPVSVEIRTMENGIPTRDVVPGSQVSLKPEYVNTSTDGSVATTFVFDYPIFADKDTEMALVVMSNSMNYNAFVSEMGFNDILTGEYISEQPYLGALFKSQNSSTWTSYDYEDLKFTMYRAQFEVGTGTITLNNAPVPTAQLASDPIQFVQGQSLVRVSHDDHHMYRQGFNDVTLEGISTGIAGTIQSGISNIDTSIIVENADNNFPSSVFGATFILKSDNEEFEDEVITGDSVYDIVNEVYSITNITRSVNGIIRTHAAGTEIELYEVGGISLDSVNGTHTIQNIGMDYYTIDVGTASSVSIATGGDEVYATENALIDSYQFMIPTITLPNTSITPTASMITGTTHTGNQGSYAVFNAGTVSLGDREDLNNPCMIASDVNEANYLSNRSSLEMTIDITTTQDNVSPVVDLSRNTVTLYNNRINYVDENEQYNNIYPDQATAELMSDAFVDATKEQNDSGETVYVTRKIQLQNPATALQTFLALSHTADSKVSILYKIQRVDDDDDFDSIGWTYYNGDGQPDVPYSPGSSEEYIDHLYSANDLPEFTAFAIKIKMDGTNSSSVPKAIDFRTIALAT